MPCGEGDDMNGWITDPHDPAFIELSVE
jgi:hypothetical protein